MSTRRLVLLAALFAAPAFAFTPFHDLAVLHSQDEANRTKGGDLGWVNEDSLLPQLRSEVAVQLVKTLRDARAQANRERFVEEIRSRSPVILDEKRLKEALTP